MELSKNLGRLEPCDGKLSSTIGGLGLATAAGYPVNHSKERIAMNKFKIISGVLYFIVVF